MAPVPAARTVVFLDVDGVLNVGARDFPGVVLLTEESLQAARAVLKIDDDWKLLRSARRIVALAKQKEEDQPPFFANDVGFSEVLLDRLVTLLRSTYPVPEVILSSNWRQPNSHSKREMLRAAIEEQLGAPFQWAGVTPMLHELSASDRLQCIGDYLANMQGEPGLETRVLVLDDFFVTPFQGWSCDGRKMRSPADAERYLLARGRQSGVLGVKVVHTYRDLSASNGDLRVHAAVGLTLDHLAEALEFVGGQKPMGDSPMARGTSMKESLGLLGKRSLIGAKQLLNGVRPTKVSI